MEKLEFEELGWSDIVLAMKCSSRSRRRSRKESSKSIDATKILYIIFKTPMITNIGIFPIFLNIFLPFPLQLLRLVNPGAGSEEELQFEELGWSDIVSPVKHSSRRSRRSPTRKERNPTKIDATI